MMILHRYHILHRDLKPENILIDENYEPRISDAALTKFFDPFNTSRSDYQSFTYMAQEVIKYNNFNPKSDVYSFGIIMYEVIIGCRCYSKTMEKKGYNPFERPTFSELYNKLSLLAEEFDGEFHERFDERELNELKYCLSDVDASKIINYISEINDETDEATKLRTEIRKLKTEVSNLNETILDQSSEIKIKDDKIKKMEEAMKIQTDQLKEKIEVEHSEVKYMREFLLEHVRNQFKESKELSSTIKLLVSIDEIFNDANIFGLFKEFCQEKLSLEYIYYIEDMASYNNMKEDCKPLLFFDFRDKYFKEGAPNFLNIQLSVIKEINNTKKPSPELLDKVLKLVFDICKAQLIREFKYSSKYIEYTSNPKSHRKSLSKKYN